jgi:hypothetical protein
VKRKAYSSRPLTAVKVRYFSFAAVYERFECGGFGHTPCRSAWRVPPLPPPYWACRPQSRSRGRTSPHRSGTPDITQYDKARRMRRASYVTYTSAPAEAPHSYFKLAADGDLDDSGNEEWRLAVPGVAPCTWGVAGRYSCSSTPSPRPAPCGSISARRSKDEYVSSGTAAAVLRAMVHRTL